MADAITTTSPNVSQPRSNTTIAVDNLLRKVLRVSDPRDPDQIANALLSRYPQEADNDRREREGYAYSSEAELQPPRVVSGGAASAELSRAQDNLERDLQSLTNASQLKTVQVEMTGWGRAIRRLAADGLAAARLSLDPVQQDRALAARRSLTEYGRLGRYVGTLSEGSGMYFRRFAQSCDSLAGLILVTVGEGLAVSGVTRSTMIVRVAASELQSRRNAVTSAFRGLLGWIDSPLAQDEQPRGIEGYRRLFNVLQDAGQSELSYLLDETALSDAMDSLVDLTTGAGVDSLRELSTTSALLVQRFERLIQITNDVASQTNTTSGLDAPPLVVFASALKLFVDSFKGRDSSRLLYLARPAILAGGLYDLRGSAGASRLTGLASDRALLAAELENLADCGCDFKAMSSEIVRDYLLYQVDRAIDLTASGKDLDGLGQAEMRAAAVGWIISRVPLLRDAKRQLYFQFSPSLNSVLNSIATRLVLPFIGSAVPPAQALAAIMGELRAASFEERRSEDLVLSLSPGAYSELFNLASADAVLTPIAGTPPVIARTSRSLIRSILAEILRVDFQIDVDQTAGNRIPNTLERSAENIEILLQGRIGGAGPGVSSGGPSAPAGGGSGGGGGPSILNPLAPNPFGLGPAAPLDHGRLNAWHIKLFDPAGGFNSAAQEYVWLEKVTGKLPDMQAFLAWKKANPDQDTFVADMLSKFPSRAAKKPVRLTEAELREFFLRADATATKL